jgi:glycosyltransferase involved in cell wall biosynthesis
VGVALEKKMNNRPRVGIFQAKWPLQVHTTNAIKVLAANGYDVDIFLYRVSQKYESLSDSIGVVTPGIRILDLSPLSENLSPSTLDLDSAVSLKQAIQTKLQTWLPIDRFWELAREARWKLTDRLEYIFHVDDRRVLPSAIFNRSQEYMLGITYKALIGVERRGLVWAGVMAGKFHIPLIYWSLELYTKDFPRYKDSLDFKRLKRLERKYHQQAQVTIIQDQARANVLLEDNGVKDSHLLLVPVSLLGPAVTVRTDYLQRMLAIPAEKKLILAFGLMARFRLTDELVRVAQDFPDDWVLVVHGPCEDDEFLRELQFLNTHKRAILSTASVPQAEVSALMASADIGLVIYAGETANDLLAGRSSEKAALYAQAGVPMVAFDYPSFMDVFQTYDCGRCVSDLSEMIEQIHKILNDYQKYRDGAFRAYSEVYEFSGHFSQVVEWINGI